MKIMEVPETAIIVYDYEQTDAQDERFAPVKAVRRVIQLVPGTINGAIVFRFYDDRTDTMYFKK